MNEAEDNAHSLRPGLPSDQLRRLQCLQMAVDLQVGAASAEAIINVAKQLDGFVEGLVSLPASEADHG